MDNQSNATCACQALGNFKKSNRKKHYGTLLISETKLYTFDRVIKEGKDRRIIHFNKGGHGSTFEIDTFILCPEDFNYGKLQLLNLGQILIVRARLEYTRNIRKFQAIATRIFPDNRLQLSLSPSSVIQ